MRINYICFLAVLLFLSSTVFAQTRVISGFVTSKEDGTGIPGANVSVKEIAGIGTITDFDGKYTIEVPEGSKILIFSFIGLETKEITIADKLEINVALGSDQVQVDEVIITAIGVKKVEKSLGYSATSVSSEDITQSRDQSAMNSLQGKVAGVTINSASGAPGASTRVILRGFSSITQSNQPLFVVDGVPINNTRYGTTDINGGTDFGNAANDLNPEDIENITVLKGASGTALYGSRAANGVIVVTTKKGNKNKKKGMEISASSSLLLDSPIRMPQMQSRYGQGFLGEVDIRENTSWGPRFDGKMRYWGYEIDGQRQIKPYKALDDNIEDFFDIGKNLTNTLTVSSGNETSSYYLSYSNVTADGIMPTDADSYARNTVSLRGTSKLSNNFTSSGSINYVHKKASFVNTGQGGQSPWNNILQIPRDMSIVDMADYKNKWNNLDNYYSAYMQNPYYTLNEYGNISKSHRVYGNIELQYGFNQYLNATFRAGTDVISENRHEWRPIVELFGKNKDNSAWTNTEEGRVTESSRFNGEFNSDFLINYSRSFGKFDISGLLGHNLNQRSSRAIWMQVKDLDIPYFYQISNSPSTPEVVEGESKRRLIGVYGSLDFDYNHFLYLTLTGRNDWSSTLPKNNRSFFYPSVNISFVLSDAFETLQKYIPYGKIRMGWAQTGNDAPPYEVHSVFVPAGHYSGYDHNAFAYPLPASPGEPPINAFEVGNKIGNPELQPEISTEFEIGTDLRFWQDRFSIDFTYYKRTITDLIFETPLSYSSGYTNQTMNLGELENKGIELLLKVTPIRMNDFNWEVSANYARNRSMVVELADGLNKSTIVDMSLSVNFMAYPGYPLGVFSAQVAQRDPQGRIVVDKVNGQPIPAEEEEIVGNSNYDFTAGIVNKFNYKNLSLSFNFDIRHGGLMWSRTADQTYFSGTAPETLFNDRQPFIIPNSVLEVEKDENGQPIYEENTTPITNTNLYTYWANGATLLEEKFLVDKSFVKLREVSLAFTIPKKWLENRFIGSASISLSGRNLFIWTPSSNTFIDPELTTFGNDLAADYGEFGATPAIRRVGATLRFTF